MVKIAVFDSGLGSLSIIRAIQKLFKAEIIYFADSQSYPYGQKSKAELNKIIKKTISILEEQFFPDFIVVASNTPSIMLNLATQKIIDVKPPLDDAKKMSNTKQVGILATQSAINSKELNQYVKNYSSKKSLKIQKINGSELVELVESGKFIIDKQYCIKIIKKILDKVILHNSIDTITLSSTHLPFLKPLLESEYPNVKFLDPGNKVAENIFSKIKNNQSKRNSLKIFTSGNNKKFQKKLKMIGIKNKVNFLSI